MTGYELLEEIRKREGEAGRLMRSGNGVYLAGGEKAHFDKLFAQASQVYLERDALEVRLRALVESE